VIHFEQTKGEKNMMMRTLAAAGLALAFAGCNRTPHL